MRRRFEPNALDSRLDCLTLALGELRISVEETVLERLVPLVSWLERKLELR